MSLACNIRTLKKWLRNRDLVSAAEYRKLLTGFIPVSLKSTITALLFVSLTLQLVWWVVSCALELFTTQVNTAQLKAVAYVSPN
jgi:hypothetical protein